MIKERLTQIGAAVAVVAAVSGPVKESRASEGITVGTPDNGSVTFGPHGETLDAKLSNQTAAMSFALKTMGGNDKDCFFVGSDGGSNPLILTQIGGFDRAILCRDKEAVYSNVPGDGEPTRVQVDGREVEVPAVQAGMLYQDNSHGPIVMGEKGNMTIVGEQQKYEPVGVNGDLVPVDILSSNLRTVFDHLEAPKDTLLGKFIEGVSYGIGAIPNTLVMATLGAFRQPKADNISLKGGDQEVKTGDQNVKTGDQNVRTGDVRVRQQQWTHLRTGDVHVGTDKKKKICPPKHNR